MSPRARWVALGSLAALATAWLFLPIHRARGTPLAVFLLDRSASSARGRPGFAAWARERIAAETSAAREAGHDVALIVFAREIALVQGPGSPAQLERWLAEHAAERLGPERGDGALASSLATALGLARTLAAEGGPPLARVVLFGDGSSTGPDPAPALAALAAEGAHFEQHAPPAPARADVSLEALTLSARVAPGAPLALAARVAVGALGEAPERARLEITVEDARGARSLVVPLALTGALEDSGRTDGRSPDGARRLVATVDLGRATEGLVRVRARLSPEPPDATLDAWPEDDVARASTVVGDALVVGLVAPQAERDALVRALAPAGEGARLEGLSFLALAPEELARALPELDLVLVLGLAPRELARAPLEAFLESGGGLAWLADERYLAGWGAEPAGAEGLLPLAPRREGGAEEIVLLVDGSGSMAVASSGRGLAEQSPFERARAAAIELARALPAEQRLVLRTFAAELDEPLVLAGDEAGEAAREAALRSVWAARAPRGPTAVCAALEALAAEREREGGDTLPVRVFVFSDGRDTQGCDLARTRAVAARLAASGARLIAVAASAEADHERLAVLAGPEGVREAAEGVGLAALLARELARERLACGLTARFATAAPDASPSAALARAVLEAQGGRAGEAVPLAPGCAPRLALRTARGDARAETVAAALWLDLEGAPLAALARSTRGAVLTLGAVPLDGLWPALAGRGDLLGPMLRALADRTRGARVVLAGGELVLEGLGADAPAVLALVLEPLEPGEGAPDAAGVLALPPTGAPLGDARVARWPEALAALPAGALVRVRAALPGLELPGLPAEVGAPPPVELAGARALPPLAVEAITAPADVRGPHPAAPFVALVSLALFALGAWASGRASPWRAELSGVDPPPGSLRDRPADGPALGPGPGTAARGGGDPEAAPSSVGASASIQTPAASQSPGRGRQI